MKKLAIIGIILIIVCQACYEDYKFDYDYTTTYFALQKPHRFLYVEEGQELSFEVGVVLGGKYVNDVEESVYFEVVDSIVSGGMEVLPPEYYTLSDNEKFVIPSGEFLGTVTVTLNESFLNDPEAANLHYVLPLKIIDSTTDSILEAKSTTQVAVEYENKYYGAYWIKGSDYLVSIFGTPYDTTMYNDPDLVRNNYRILETIDLDNSSVEYLGADLSGRNKMELGFAADGNITITPDSGNVFTEFSGSGMYNAEEQIITLEYNYRDTLTFRHLVQDTLIFFDKPFDHELMTW